MLTLTLKRKELDAVIDEQAYLLREMSGKVYTDYMQTQANRVRVDGAGKMTGRADLTNLQSSLVGLCLYAKNVATGQWDPVEVATVNGWPASVVAALFEACQELNGIETEKQSRAKAEAEAAGKKETAAPPA